MIQLSLFPDRIEDEVIIEEVVLVEYPKEQACYIAANYLEDICLSDAVMQHLDQDEIDEIAATIAVLRG